MGYYCNECKKTISKTVYDFSKSKYDKPLCKAHQRATKSTPQTKELASFLERKGWKVELEKWDGHKHIDIAITKAKVNIEVDGAKHTFSEKQALSDLKRTYYSFKKGYVTLRIPNALVKNKRTLEETANYINDFLKESSGQLE